MAKYHIISEEGDVSFIADVDLTAKQYYFVMPASTDGNVTTSTGASNSAPMGVLQNSPSLGQEARVRVHGFSKVVGENGGGGCNLKFGRYVYSASDGQAESACIATCPVNARWLGNTYTGTASIYGEVILFTGGLAVCPLALA